MTRRLPRPPAVALVFLLLLLVAPAARAASSPATTNGFFIFAGRVAGQGGALFRTDVWLFNPDTAASAVVTLTFREQVSSGGGASTAINSAPITLSPRETRFLPDLTLTTVPAGDNRVGSLEWTSDRVVLASARVYTQAPNGTFGFFLPGIPVSESLGAKTSAGDAINVLQIYGLNSGDPANFRTGLDVVNTATVAVPVEVRVIDPVTGLIYGGTQNFSIAPKSLLRVGAILTAVGAPQVAGLRITVAIREGTALPGGGGILAVGTTVDNRTTDAFAFVGQRQAGSIVPAALLPLDDLP
ncbi:MAG: hypothetical protein H7X85_08960 [Thermoanaerobaculia bacterium]|nr:hypothetical protein [Thermoanaerobaculia bacterium]